MFLPTWFSNVLGLWCTNCLTPMRNAIYNPSEIRFRPFESSWLIRPPRTSLCRRAVCNVLPESTLLSLTYSLLEPNRFTALMEEISVLGNVSEISFDFYWLTHTELDQSEWTRSFSYAHLIEINPFGVGIALNHGYRYGLPMAFQSRCKGLAFRVFCLGSLIIAGRHPFFLIHPILGKKRGYIPSRSIRLWEYQTHVALT